MSKLPLLSLNMIPLPGELVQLNIDQESQKSLIADIYANGQTFGIFYNHFMNLHQIAAQVELVGATMGEYDGVKDIWVKGKSILTMSRIYPSNTDNQRLEGDILHAHQWTNMSIGEQIDDDMEEFIKYCPNGLVNGLKNKKEHKIFDILRLMQLSDSEKFYVLNLASEKDLYLYIVNSLRLRVSYYRQKRSIDEPWFLN